MATKGKKGFNPFMGKETKAEEKAEKGKKPMAFAKGGSIDGVAQRGKTKGKQIKMKCGGKVHK